MRFPRLLASILFALGPCAPAAAQQSPHPLQPGTYLFETNARVERRPVCSEQWELRADGSMTVRSGEEIVEKRYRLTHDRDGDWVASTSISTNGTADCTGTVTRSLNTDEHRTYLVAFNDGGIAVCPAPTHAPDGSPYVSNCYGSLRRVEPAR